MGQYSILLEDILREEREINELAKEFVFRIDEMYKHLVEGQDESGFMMKTVKWILSSLIGKPIGFLFKTLYKIMGLRNTTFTTVPAVATLYFQIKNYTNISSLDTGGLSYKGLSTLMSTIDATAVDISNITGAFFYTKVFTPISNLIHQILSAGVESISSPLSSIESITAESFFGPVVMNSLLSQSIAAAVIGLGVSLLIGIVLFMGKTDKR